MIFSVSPLFEGQLPTEANKHTLVSEIEKLLDLSQWSCDTDLNTHVIVDFMSKIRQMPLGEMSNIGRAIEGVYKSAASISRMIESIHMIYDSYIELCLKEPCRLRRYDPSDAIELVGMSEQSEIPKQLQKFWSSIPNKENIQLLSRKRNDPSVISSSMVVNGELLPALCNGNEIPELNSWIEEGEMHSLPHID